MSGYIYLNTRDRDEGSNDDAIFYMNQTQLAGTWRLTIESISFPHTMYPFSAARCNNILYMQTAGVTGTTYEAVIPTNNYNATQFIAALKTALDSATGDTWTVTYDSQSGRMNMNSGGPTWRIIDGECSAREEVGWNPSRTGFTSGAALTLPTPLDLSGTQYVDISTNIAGNSYNSTGTYTTLVRIPVVQSFGEVIIYTSNFPHSLITRGSVDQINLQLRDDKGRRLNLQENSHVSYAIKLDRLGE